MVYFIIHLPKKNKNPHRYAKWRHIWSLNIQFSKASFWVYHLCCISPYHSHHSPADSNLLLEQLLGKGHIPKRPAKWWPCNKTMARFGTESKPGSGDQHHKPIFNLQPWWHWCLGRSEIHLIIYMFFLCLGMIQLWRVHVTLPETNDIAPENRPLEKEVPTRNHHF